MRRETCQYCLSHLQSVSLRPSVNRQTARKQLASKLSLKQNREVYHEKRRNKLKAAKDARKIQALERELVQSNLHLEIALKRGKTEYTGLSYKIWLQPPSQLSWLMFWLKIKAGWNTLCGCLAF